MCLFLCDLLVGLLEFMCGPLPRTQKSPESLQALVKRDWRICHLAGGVICLHLRLGDDDGADHADVGLGYPMLFLLLVAAKLRTWMEGGLWTGLASLVLVTLVTVEAGVILACHCCCRLWTGLALLNSV